MGYTLNKKNINVGKKIKISSDSLSDVYMVNRGIALRVYKDNIDRCDSAYDLFDMALTSKGHKLQ